MATLVLAAAGQVLGGPIGQAIGATIGNYIDREVLFKPKGREGPRLTELAVQTSSYGTQLPKLFGTMRVAGSVIWSTDLIEHRSAESGKGRPTVTNYSYTASLAVALSARSSRCSAWPMSVNSMPDNAETGSITGIARSTVATPVRSIRSGSEDSAMRMAGNA